MLKELDDSKPKYIQIYESIQELIEVGRLMPGDLIPSEREYADMLGVSRMTVRSAINDLVRDGLLVRHQGRSTVVASPKLEKTASGFMSFSEDMVSRGLIPSSKVIKFGEEVADVSVSAQLELPTGSRTIFLKRVRFANDEPMALERVHIPYDRFSPLLSLELSNISLYEILEKEYNCRPESSEESLEAVSLHADEAKLLGVPAGSPALLTRRITKDADGQVIETVESLYRADRYRVVLSRNRQESF